jgi:hypothetical protein
LTRVARWFIFPVFGTFWKAFEWKISIAFLTFWHPLWPFALYYGNLVYFVVVCYIFPILVYCIKRNLATLRLTLNIVLMKAFVTATITAAKLALQQSLKSLNSPNYTERIGVNLSQHLFDTMCTLGEKWHFLLKS